MWMAPFAGTIVGSSSQSEQYELYEQTAFTAPFLDLKRTFLLCSTPTKTHETPLVDSRIHMMCTLVSISFGSRLPICLEASIHFTCIITFVLFGRRSPLYFHTAFRFVWNTVSKNIGYRSAIYLDACLHFTWTLFSVLFGIHYPKKWIPVSNLS